VGCPLKSQKHERLVSLLPSKKKKRKKGSDIRDKKKKKKIKNESFFFKKKKKKTPSQSVSERTIIYFVLFAARLSSPFSKNKIWRK